jgi:hypothetical protein
LVSRRAGSREDIADGMIIAIAEVLLTLANDLFFDAGGKTSGTARVGLTQPNSQVRLAPIAE